MIRKLLSVLTLGIISPRSAKNRQRVADAKLADAQRRAIRRG